MTKPEHYYSKEPREQETDPFLENLVRYVSERDPQVLIDEIVTRAQENPNLDAEAINHAIKFAVDVHTGQERKHDDKPEGEKKPFITHPLAAALVVDDLMGENVTTESLVLTILHDTYEDGMMHKGTLQERHVTREDIRRLFGEEMATGVELMSDVRDEIKPDGSVQKRKLHLDKERNKEMYFDNVDILDKRQPTWGIYFIKAGGDRMTNLTEPFRPLETEREIDQKTATSRKSKLKSTEKHLVPRLANQPILLEKLRTVMTLSSHTMDADFSLQNWKHTVPKPTAS